MASRVLLLEDDVLLSEILVEFLNEHHFEVYHCEDAIQAINLAYEQNFDTYLLDVMVQTGDGFDVLSELRKMGKTTPTIFITSLSSMEDLEQGYKSGCDDYIRKPFELGELLLRMNVLLKRNFAHKNTDFEDFGNGVRFEFYTKSVYRGDRLVFLPKKEIRLLSIFVEKPNQFITQQEIYDELWEYDEHPSDMSLRVYVKNLRNLIGKDKIVNQRGNGYCYVKQ